METIMVLWFVLLSPDIAGHIEPIRVTPAACGRPVQYVALHGDREVNPRVVRWADCEVDIRAKVSTLPAGVYEFAATGFGTYEAPDPHTSPTTFVVSADFEEQAPARRTSRFTWGQDGADLATIQAYRFDLELDGQVLPTPLAKTCTGTTSPFTCEAPIPAVTPTTHTARVRAVDVSDPANPDAGDWSDPLNFTMRASPAKPGTITIRNGGN